MRAFVVWREGRSGSIAETVSSASCLCLPDADRTSAAEAADALATDAGSRAAGSVDGSFLGRTASSINSASTWRGDDESARLLSSRFSIAAVGRGAESNVDRGTRREMLDPERLPSDPILEPEDATFSSESRFERDESRSSFLRRLRSSSSSGVRRGSGVAVSSSALGCLEEGLREEESLRDSELSWWGFRSDGGDLLFDA